MPSLLVLDDLHLLCPGEAEGPEMGMAPRSPALAEWLADALDELRYLQHDGHWPLPGTGSGHAALHSLHHCAEEPPGIWQGSGVCAVAWMGQSRQGGTVSYQPLLAQSRCVLRRPLRQMWPPCCARPGGWTTAWSWRRRARPSVQRC